MIEGRGSCHSQSVLTRSLAELLSDKLLFCPGETTGTARFYPTGRILPVGYPDQSASTHLPRRRGFKGFIGGNSFPDVFRHGKAPPVTLSF